MNEAMAQLPDRLEQHKSTGTFTEKTVPAGLLNDHSTKEGVWGLIRVEAGKLHYRITDERRPAFETVLTPETPPGVVEPTIRHHVQPLGKVCFHVDFLRARDGEGV